VAEHRQDLVTVGDGLGSGRKVRVRRPARGPAASGAVDPAASRLELLAAGRTGPLSVTHSSPFHEPHAHSGR
jgi:hypothetical protein